MLLWSGAGRRLGGESALGRFAPSNLCGTDLSNAHEIHINGNPWLDVWARRTSRPPPVICRVIHTWRTVPGIRCVLSFPAERIATEICTGFTDVLMGHRLR